MKKAIPSLGCLVLAVTAASGCVSQAKYDEAVAQTELTRAQLDAAHAEHQRTKEIYDDVVHKLKSQIDAGELQVEIRDERMVLDMQNDILFDSGRVDIKPAGAKDLDAVADVLKSLPDRQFQVAGHTDNVPISTAQYPSNWELSSARAIRVIHYLNGKGVRNEQLSAAGYAAVDPVASNDTPEGRKQNRRLEITLQPKITEVHRTQPKQ
jgi:chemotaxis protein MotB